MLPHTHAVHGVLQGLQYAKEELAHEHECIMANGDPYNDSIYLRMMLDVLRYSRKLPARLNLIC